MRILFWTDTFWPVIGGVETLAADFLRAMRARGHEFTLITRQDNPDWPERDEFAGTPVHRFPFWQTIKRGDIREIVQMRDRLARLKAAIRPDLDHIFHSGPGLFFHLLTVPRPAPPQMVSLHQPFITETLAPNTTRGRIMRQADWVVACSQSVLADTLAQLPEIGGRASVIVNSLPMPDLAPAPPPPAPVLLCIGRGTYQKGFDVAVQAFARLAGRYPQARLVLAGEGEAVAVARELAQALGVAGAVDFLGWVQPAQVPALINRSTIVLMPSRFEPFGLVALEAGQMTRPVVASNVDGLPEAVVHGETGLLVEPENPAALAEATARLLDDPQLAARIGQAGRRRAEVDLSWERHLQAYEELYQRLAGGRRAAAG